MCKNVSESLLFSKIHVRGFGNEESRIELLSPKLQMKVSTSCMVVL